MEKQWGCLSFFHWVFLFPDLASHALSNPHLSSFTVSHWLLFSLGGLVSTVTLTILGSWLIYYGIKSSGDEGQPAGEQVVIVGQ